MFPQDIRIHIRSNFQTGLYTEIGNDTQTLWASNILKLPLGRAIIEHQYAQNTASIIQELFSINASDTGAVAKHAVGKGIIIMTFINVQVKIIANMYPVFYI